MAGFELTGVYDAGLIQLNNTVIIIDPCYAANIWCSKCLNIQEGKYKCFLRIIDGEECGRQVSLLFVIHENYLNRIGFNDGFQFDPKKICKVAYHNVIGVDSGQAGIFNYDYYVKNQPDNKWDPGINGEKSWYRRICDLTCSEELGGIIENNGVVSRSGDGDGPYTCATFYDVKTEEIIGIVIDYQVE